MSFLKSQTGFPLCVALIFTLLSVYPAFSSRPSRELHLALSDSLDENELFLLNNLESTFDSSNYSSAKIIEALSNLNRSLDYKYRLINELTKLDFNNSEFLNILAQFINHVQEYEPRFEKSLQPYSYHIYKLNISKIFFYLAEISVEQDISQYLIESVAYNPNVGNTTKLGDHFASHQNYMDALSFYLEGLQIDSNSPSIRIKAESCYKQLYETTVSFDQYVESFNKQQVDIFIESIELPKRNDRLKVLNDYGFGRRFYKEMGILLIAPINQDSNYLLNSLHELSQRTDIMFQAILINKGEGMDEYQNVDYISVFPELYQADIWNDFQLSAIPTLIFIGNRQRELLRINSFNRELPSIIETILKKDLLTEF